MHAKRLRRYGDASVVKKLSSRHHGVTLSDRLWARVVRGAPDACWEWQGATDKDGYGRIGRGGRGAPNNPAHRVAFEISRGPIPYGLLVCHHCDNPPCCNPAHLFLGTHQDNQADKVAKGRQARGSTAGRCS